MLYFIGCAFTLAVIAEEDNKWWQEAILIFLWPITLGIMARALFDKIMEEDK